ncbi:HEAT repeat domain-containing protein [Aliterella atlantica]|nr:HEAT repeat domain-containing protein [Aliterella atlantica]
MSALLIACVDVDASVRKAAFDALNSIDPNWTHNSETQKALPRLTKEFKHLYCFKKSYSEEVSKAADKLLRQIGKPAVSYLANLIVEEEDKIEYKIHAIWILKDIGSDATSAVPQLIQVLSCKASKVRIAAAEALANFRTAAKAAIPEIFVGLADRDVDVREAMLTCLVAIEPEVADLLPFLVHKNPNVREAVADALIQIRPQALPALTAVVLQWCTNSKAGTENVETNQKMTEAVLQLLGKFGPDASVAMPTIALALVDPNPTIKLAAVRALENIDRDWLSDPAVVKAIVSFAGGEAAIPELIVGLADQNEDVRKAMMACLIATETAVPDLLPLLVDKNPNVREAALDILIQIGSHTLPALIRIVSQGCTKSRTDIDNVEQYQKMTEAALQVLGEIGSDASLAMPTIALALVAPNPTIKLAAVRALGNIDHNWVSNPAIVKAIVSLAGAEAAISKIVVGFTDRNSDVRKAMVRCLVQFGATAKPAVPNLQRLLTDLDPEVRKAAADALMQIDPKPTAIEKHADPPSRDTLGKYFRPEPSASAQASHIHSKSSSQLHSLKRDLLRLLQGDSQACQRLIELERRKNPQRKEDELYEIVIYQLVRDRR